MLFSEIDRQRRCLGISAHRLSKTAGVQPSTYFRAARGRVTPSSRTLARWAEALAQAPVVPDRKFTPERYARMIWRGYVVVLAPRLGAAATDVLASKPRRRATSDPVWNKCALIRSAAIYCTVTALGVRGATLARGMGLSKQAVSLALRRIEAMRDNAEFDALLAEIEPLFVRPDEFSTGQPTTGDDDER